jgi:hypothetical protein
MRSVPSVPSVAKAEIKPMVITNVGPIFDANDEIVTGYDVDADVEPYNDNDVDDVDTESQTSSYRDSIDTLSHTSVEDSVEEDPYLYKNKVSGGMSVPKTKMSGGPQVSGRRGVIPNHPKTKTVEMGFPNAGSGCVLTMVPLSINGKTRFCALTLLKEDAAKIETMLNS